VRRPAGGNAMVEADACTNELQKCIKVLIQGLGEDCAREGLLDTPLVGRVQHH
jgi:GTP cyclohydrolase I